MLMALRLRVGLVLARADVDAGSAAGAVLGRHLDGPLQAGVVLAPGVHRLEGRGRSREECRVVDLGADGGVRAVEGALAALDAEVGLPHGDLEGDVALLPLGGVGGPYAVGGHGADREAVSVAGHDGGRDGLDELRRLFGDDGRLHHVAGRPLSAPRSREEQPRRGPRR